MKRAFLGSVLVVSLLGAVGCGDDAHHDEDENSAEGSDSGFELSSDGAVIRGGSRGLDGGTDITRTPDVHDSGAAEAGELQADGGRQRPGEGRGFDAGFARPQRDGGRLGAPRDAEAEAPNPPGDGGRRHRDGGPNGRGPNGGPAAP